MTNTYIKTGTRVRVYDGSVITSRRLDAGTYRVAFNPLEGFSLVQVDNMVASNEKVYGDRDRKVDKVFRTYNSTARSLGIMLSGDKGQGKTMFLRMLAERAQESGMPVVMVTEAYDGIAGFLDSLDECMVVFDEFEKVFPTNSGAEIDYNLQHQFLPLFDGASLRKRMYCITVNNLMDLSDYLRNRPGRFHYHMRFNYPDGDAIREYMHDQVSGIAAATVNAVVKFASMTKINYDHLRAIAAELRSNPDAEFNELLEDLNIKEIDQHDYDITVVFKNGVVATAVARMSFSSQHRTSFYLHSAKYGEKYTTLNTANVSVDDLGNMVLPPENLDITSWDSDSEGKKPEVATVTAKLAAQRTYAFAAL